MEMIGECRGEGCLLKHKEHLNTMWWSVDNLMGVAAFTIPFNAKNLAFEVESEICFCVGADGFEPPTLCL